MQSLLPPSNQQPTTQAAPRKSNATLRHTLAYTLIAGLSLQCLQTQAKTVTVGGDLDYPVEGNQDYDLVSIGSDGTLIIRTQALMILNSSGKLENEGMLENNSTLENRGELNNYSASTLNNFYGSTLENKAN